MGCRIQASPLTWSSKTKLLVNKTGNSTADNSHSGCGSDHTVQPVLMVVRYTSGGPRRQLLLPFCIISEERDRERVCKENKTLQNKRWTDVLQSRVTRLNWKELCSNSNKVMKPRSFNHSRKKPSMFQINDKLYVQIFTMWNSWLHDQKLLVLNFPHIWNMKRLFTRSQSAKTDRNINTNTHHLCLLRASCEPNYMLGYIIYVSNTDVILHLFIKPHNCLNKFS